MRPIERVVISFSGGATSAYMTDRLLQMEKDGLVIVEHIIFCNTGKEHEGTLQFVENCSEHWGREIVWLEYAGVDYPTYYKIVSYSTASRKGEPFKMLIQKHNSLPNMAIRFCTVELKIWCVDNFLKDRDQFDLRQVIGIRADEPERYYRTSQNELKYMPLFKWGVTKPMVNEFWANMPFKLEIPARLGNCDFCFLKGINKRRNIARENPEIPLWWAEMEDMIAKGQSIKKISRNVRKFMRENPAYADFIETARKYNRDSRFDKDYSVKNIINKVQSMADVFEEGNDIDCACNID